MSRPILPARLAVDTVEEIKGFVSALLYARKTSTYSAILKCLFEDDPMVKGPFISLHLPFVRDTSTAWPLDPLLKEGFAPYAHQSKAFARLSGDHPQHTLVTTGTGSGKSECFILPLMDYVMRCKRQGQSKGVKALIIYPMNALIEDQGERLSEIANRLNKQLNPEQHIRVGRYTGASGQTLSHSPMHPKQIIDDRDTLCADPPDILLTNYKMLDFMLFRPEEQKFWGLDTQNAFRYLVLDELHTFDGAQGADVACLIRRLRLKLRKEFVCIGTSATVAGGGTDNGDALQAGRLQLCKFATTLFGTEIGLDAILGEERLSIDSYLSIDPTLTLPTKPLPHKNLLRRGKDAYGDFLNSLCQHWSAPIDDIERGLWIRSHPLTLSLLKTEVTGQSLTEIAKTIGIETDLLVEFLDLLASARMDGNPAQVFNLGVQIWVSETGYLLRKLSPEPEFKRYLDKHEDGYLPAVNCQSCGLSGWFTSLEENPSEEESFRLEYDTKKIFQDFFQKDGVVLFPRDAGDTVFDPLNIFCYDLESGWLRRGRTIESRHIPMHVALLSDEHQNSVILSSRRGKGQKDFTRCPECDDPLRLSFSGVSRSMLASVLSSSFLAHGANPDDRKILMFNDSVQDTAHQAGYISARSYRFNLRRVLYRILKEISRDDLVKGMNLAKFRQKATRHLAQMWQEAARERVNSKSRQDREKTRELMQLIPKDLWDQWTGSGQGNPLHVDGNQPILIDRILWEFWLELTLHRNLGWSLAKSGLLIVTPTDELIKGAMEVLENCVARAHIPMLEAPELFLRGFLDHLVTKAAVYHKDLEAVYGKQKGKFNLWPLLYAKPHLKSLFGPRAAHPHILSLEPSLGGKHQRSPIQYLTSRKGQTWYQNWVNKHLPTHQDKSIAGKVDHFLDLLVKGLAAHKIGLQSIHLENQVNFVVSDNILMVQQVPLHTFQCPRCGAMKMVPRTQNFSEARCEQYRCWGRLEALSSAEESGRDAFLAFLSSNYERDVEAPFAHTHTGGLDAADRRRVEQAFKQNLLPGDSMNENGRGAPYYKDHPINVLACTPTLEMGIDIGSLSGVILRGFPRSLASTLQRLGRAGRKSGNAFNTILAGRGAHDRYQWSHPMDFFKGSVTAPGCRFRTKDLLRRQFHAYLLDTYVGSKEGLNFPSSRNLEDNADFLHHPFWRGFEDFLTSVDQTKVTGDFLTAIKLGQVDEEVAYDEIHEYLGKAFEPEGLWDEIAEVLLEQDRERAADEQHVVALNRILDVSSSVDPEQETSANLLEIDRQKAMKQSRATQTRTGEYTLSILASRGILPNYAFPENGILFQCQATVPTRSNSSEWRKRFRVVTFEVTRPTDPGLRELAPTSTYYIDSIKAPITRIEKGEGENSNLRQVLLCEGCGHVAESIKNPQACPVCRSDRAILLPVITPRVVISSGDFSQMQIRDADENRESTSLRIEPFINFQGNEKKDQRATWVSRGSCISFEFRIQGTINFMVRGPKFGKEYRYFDLCEQCWAVPYRKDEQEGWIFQTKWETNRHAAQCSHFKQPNGIDIPIIKAALGRQIKSDTIRFSARNEAMIPSLRATLLLAMRLRLGGEPQHLGVAISYLNTDTNGRQAVATLYDKVPGGTGHLRSLMPMLGDTMTQDTHGLVQLKKTFEETQRHLVNCSCEDGCYKCLLSYENQYQHKSISRKLAIQWLVDFISANDWEYEQEGIDAVLATDTVFDSQAEQLFVDGALKKNSPFLKVKSSSIDLNHPEKTICLQLPDGQPAFLFHSAHRRVYLGNGYAYTKPDFRLEHDGKIKAYIYIDGAKDHLNADKSSSTFLTQDIYLRKALLEKFRTRNEGPKVLSFTWDMLECWTKWIEERDRADFLTLDHMLHKQSAQRIPTLLLLLIGKFLPEKSQIPGIEGDIKSWRRDVFSSFISANINHCLFPKTSPFCDDSSIKKIEATLPKTLANGVKYSGLTFHLNNGDFYFTMSDEKSLRAPNNAFDPDYRDAWSIYWILWSIKPEWIRQEKVKSTKKPKAYEHLTPIEKLIFDKLSDSDFEFKIMEPTDEDDDHGLSAPFLTCQNLLCYMKQSLSVSETELKKALSHRYRILILDGNDSVIDNVKRVQNALRT